jgi:hypothetical protein
MEQGITWPGIQTHFSKAFMGDSCRKPYEKCGLNERKTLSQCWWYFNFCAEIIQMMEPVFYKSISNLSNNCMRMYELQEIHGKALY